MQSFSCPKSLTKTGSSSCPTKKMIKFRKLKIKQNNNTSNQKITKNLNMRKIIERQGDKMTKFKKLSKVYFSPSGSTEKIVNEVAKSFNMNRENYDLLSFDDEKTFDDELVIIGVPVFNGRIPKTAQKRLSKMKGTDTKTIVILNYGNMEYVDALLELTELLKENGFNIIGIATTVSENSLFSQIAHGRPDENDLKKISEFSKNVYEKIENGDENEIFVGGYKPFVEHEIPQFNVECDDSLCVECLDCAYTCPEDAIDESTPTMTSIDDCSRCSTCINICSEGARSFGGAEYELEKQNATENYMMRKEAEFYL